MHRGFVIDLILLGAAATTTTNILLCTFYFEDGITYLVGRVCQPQVDHQEVQNREVSGKGKQRQRGAHANHHGVEDQERIPHLQVATCGDNCKTREIE